MYTEDSNIIVTLDIDSNIRYKGVKAVGTHCSYFGPFIVCSSQAITIRKLSLM